MTTPEDQMTTPENEKKGASPALLAGLGVGGCAILVVVCLATAVVVIAILTLLGPAIGDVFSGIILDI